ncbi:MAG: quercetin dioxygenase-like cupin family protein, partial [Arenicella sp.]
MTNILKSTHEEIDARIVRFNDMVPCKTAFIDARTPGSDKKENFCLIGQGVAENPDQVVHIEIPHGFNIGAARQPKGCKNSHHSHNTEEVFMIHSGAWEFTWGINGEDGAITLHAGDTISLPTHMFRGFENVGDEEALMFSIIGLEADLSAGHVLWA